MDEKIMNNVYEVLKEATDHGMQVEVIYYTLQEMKNDPTIGIDAAMYRGFNEWVK